VAHDACGERSNDAATPLATAPVAGLVKLPSPPANSTQFPPPPVLTSFARCSQNASGRLEASAAAARRFVSVTFADVPVAVGFWMIAAAAVPPSAQPVISTSMTAPPVWLTPP